MQPRFLTRIQKNASNHWVQVIDRQERVRTRLLHKLLEKTPC